MKTHLVLTSALLFLSVLLSSSVSAQQPQKLSYADLVAKVKKGDHSVDFKELRLAYTETKEYRPYGGDRTARKTMFAALNAKDYELALQQSDKLLAANFIDLNAHFIAFAANKGLGNAEKSAFYKYIFEGLLSSITDSGDGKTTDTALVVISTDEEYVLFNYLGLKVGNQALVEDKGHHFDRMTAVNSKTGETVVYYFNIDKPFNWLGNSLKP